METHERLFAKMTGSEVLTYLRDAVLTVATRRRSLLEQSAAIDGGTPVSSSELAEARALDAAAEALQFALSAGQEASAKGRSAPDWVMRMITQARVTLTSPED